jgi:hypothetical protein
MKRSILTAVAAAAVFNLLAAKPASATQYVSTIVQVPGAPITVDGCVNQVDQEIVSVPEFTNTSKQTINAVELKVVIYDAFDTQLDTETIQQAGTFSPGVGIRVKRLFGVPLASDCIYVSSIAAKTSCSVDKVRFTDGTIWTAPIAAAAPG